MQDPKNTNNVAHQPLCLTEFDRSFEDEPETILTKIASKLSIAYNAGLKNNVEKPRSYIEHEAKQGIPAVVETVKSGDSTAEKYDSKTNFGDEQSAKQPIGTFKQKGVIDVFNRISSAVTYKNAGVRDYKNTRLHRFWMPDEKAKECYECFQKFTSFRRKHHCRLCGQIFCSKCCNKVVPGKIIMCSGDSKVCSHCSRVVLSYMKSMELIVDLDAIQDNLSSGTTHNASKSEAAENSSELGLLSGYQEEKLLSNSICILSKEDRINILKESNSLKTLYEEMIKCMPPQNPGVSFLSFLITTRKSINKSQAIAILNAMVAAGFLIPLVFDFEATEFDEILHYKLASFNKVGNNDIRFSSPLSQISENEVAGKHECAASTCLLLAETELHQMLSRTNMAKQLLELYCEYEERTTNSLLATERLEQSWANVLLPLCAKIVRNFHPEFSVNDSIDIRNYVNFKKVKGGMKNDCQIKSGVVFTKNVVYKSMAGKIQYPKVLLVQCPIIYERMEGKYVSLESLLLQEKEYLTSIVARILNLKPNIILTQKWISSVAKEILEKNGITIVSGVKSSVITRLAKFLNCDIVTSMDSIISQPKLGTCDLFFTEKFWLKKGVAKTFIGLENYSNSKNYTFILRGGDDSELSKVKWVTSALLYTRYSWRFEMSFLLDIYARLPNISSWNNPEIEKDLVHNEPPEIPYSSKQPVQMRGGEMKKNIAMGSDVKQNFTGQDTVSKKESECTEAVKEFHGLILDKITSSNNTGDLVGMLSDFRAFGSQFKRRRKPLELVSQCTVVNTNKLQSKFNFKANTLWRYHQLSVLFCSYYNNPKTAASFCARPTILDMSFYGQRDILLGQFLEKYCFKSYICQSCNLPMVNHVRRYVNSAGCVQVVLEEHTNSSISDDIFVTTWCTKCDETTPAVPISSDTWCLSFAKYLEIRFHGDLHQKHCPKSLENPLPQLDNVNNITCSHAVHQDYVQYFYSKGLGVRFTYSPITVWTVNFPRSEMLYRKRKRTNISEVDSALQLISYEGRETYKSLCKKILSSTDILDVQDRLETLLHKQQLSFQQMVEEFHAQASEFSANERAINCNLCILKSKLDEDVMFWKARLQNPLNQNTDIKYDNCSDKVAEISDLKSQCSSQEHHLLSQETIQATVSEQDLSSIIAYSLISEDYLSFIDSIPHNLENTNEMLTNYDNVHGSIDSDPKDEKRTDDEKKSKCKPHFDLTFQDLSTQFVCKVYFAREFDLLRSKLYRGTASNSRELRTLFAQSLRKSYQWDARGGKSGLKFSKTYDDRFILKEMTKGDVGLFESFAPNYFEYINNCIDNERLSLLAKIYGVFKVTVKKKDFVQERSLLVMENLFFDWNISDKFDLKGSERNRLVNTSNDEGDIVLLDENLIQMSWSKPLYISNETKKYLCDTISMDTGFLERNSIIDYSLLVGLDVEKRTLVLGIIDYIRTFTLDKRLESFVKQSGLLGGQGKLPTVISPTKYKQRFIEAMDKYFLSVPT